MTNTVAAGATPANVAAQATLANALDASVLNLLGIFGPADDLRALIRLPGGRVHQVTTGNRLSSGRIVAIDETGLMVLKNGRTTRITIPGS